MEKQIKTTIKLILVFIVLKIILFHGQTKNTIIDYPRITISILVITEILLIIQRTHRKTAYPIIEKGQIRSAIIDIIESFDIPISNIMIDGLWIGNYLMTSKATDEITKTAATAIYTTSITIPILLSLIDSSTPEGIYMYSIASMIAATHMITSKEVKKNGTNKKRNNNSNTK